MRAQVRLSLVPLPDKEKKILRRLTSNPMVRSIHRVSGEDCYVAQVRCRRIEDVNALLLSLQATRGLQSSRTAFVLETIVEKGTLGPIDDSLLPEPS